MDHDPNAFKTLGEHVTPRPPFVPVAVTTDTTHAHLVHEAVSVLNRVLVQARDAGLTVGLSYNYKGCEPGGASGFVHITTLSRDLMPKVKA